MADIGQSLSLAFGVHELPVPAAPRRLFTALFPDAAACAAIDAERRRWGGLPERLHPVPQRMHLTLQCFGRVPAPAAQAWQAALAALRFAPFQLALDRAALWQAPSGTIAVLLPAPSAALHELHQASARLARAAGLPAATQGFRPHLTALRGAQAAGLLPLRQPIAWTVRAVELICSDLRARPPCYHRLGRFLSE